MNWQLAIKFARALLADSRYYNREGYLIRKNIQRDFANGAKCSDQHAAWVITYLSPPLTNSMGQSILTEESAVKLVANFMKAKKTWRKYTSN